MKSICFFTNFHNGDLHNSRFFIKEIISSIDTKCYYHHNNNPMVLFDLDLEYGKNTITDNYVKFFEDENTVYVNTWIGCYFDKEKPYHGECTLRFSYQMFGEIYEYLNEKFGCNLKLSPIENYLPEIDYSKYKIEQIDQFLELNPQDKILFSNGPCLSGQSNYNGNMQEIVEAAANLYPDKLFLCTDKFSSTFDNIKFTGDIIKCDGCDLNEISYLSKFCGIIIGRNSGPFCFTFTKENLNDPTKTFYAFGERETDCFCYGIDIDCNFIFEYYSSLDNLQNSILNLVEQL